MDKKNILFKRKQNFLAHNEISMSITLYITVNKNSSDRVFLNTI